MAKTRPSARTQKIPGQDTFDFNGTPQTIYTYAYNLELAREAAEHRRKRRDELALTPRTRGFNRRVEGLWVPHSGTENTAVVSIPRNYVKASRLLVKNKVLEKYEGSEISPKRVLLWAYFASHQVGRQLKGKFDEFTLDARRTYEAIHWGLGENWEIERDRFEENTAAYKGVLRYLIYLRTFVGSDSEVLGKGEKRKWPQDRHRHVMANHLAWAATYLSRQTTEEFGKTVQEAYYSERSRQVFWLNVEKEHDAFLRAQARVQETVPIEVYANDPRADERNYINDEYIE